MATVTSRGKRTNPLYGKFSFLLKIEDHISAQNELRRLRDGRDFSDLMQELLEGWLSKQK